MYEAVITLPTDVIAAINDQIGQSPGLMNTAYNRATSGLRRNWKADLRVEPPEASGFYPLTYKSLKQLRKVQALRRERGGGAYERNHDLSQGWQVDIASADDGGEIDVYNESGIVDFVEGQNRQPMFDPGIGGVPWLDPDLINVQYLEQAEELLIQTWYTVSDPFGGVNG